MKILGGKFRGRPLGMPRHIRPTQNKVRKAIFDIMGDIEGLSFLELFAGSGAVGFEAASRGVGELTMVESDDRCLSVLKRNLAAFGVNCGVYLKDAEGAIRYFHSAKKTFDIVFLDPPYYQELAKKALQTIGAYDILAPNGFVIVQHFKRDILPETAGNLRLLRQRSYGDTLLSIYQKNVPESDLSG
jgi:16S rRNA (guanine966-N2)-methyltransferase